MITLKREAFVYSAPPRRLPGTVTAHQVVQVRQFQATDTPRNSLLCVIQLKGHRTAGWISNSPVYVADLMQ